jgi:hypothetical protein
MWQGINLSKFFMGVLTTALTIALALFLYELFFRQWIGKLRMKNA